MNRRKFLSAATVPILGLTGCLQQEESPEAKNSEEPEMRLESSVDEVSLPRAEFELTVTNEGPGETPFVVMTHRLAFGRTRDVGREKSRG
jgi:hypothetical protein